MFWINNVKERAIATKPPFRPPHRDNEIARVNEKILANEIRLIDQNGEMHGVMSVAKAMRMAEEAGLDLVEVSPNAEPPVCKILDYGKFKYEHQKKANEARKKQKTVDVKEIKLRPTIEDHDFQVKLKSARRFFEEGDKVKVTLRFRGREMAHKDMALAVLDRFRDALIDVSKVDAPAKMEGKQAIMVLSPDKSGATKPVKAPAAPASAPAPASAAQAESTPAGDPA